jgi:D-glycero-alpha-D-manno-heptose-7-phosphate kinase
LGSSGAFTVALLKALYTLHKTQHTTAMVAETACSIEIEKLKEPVGKQDQYASAFGGINRFDIDTQGRVTVTPIAVPAGALEELEEHLCLFFTKQRRSASVVLKHQDDLTKKSGGSSSRESDAVLQNLHQTKALGVASALALEQGDLTGLARLMSEQWEQKRARSPGATNEAIVHGYVQGMKHGALGGKLIGAGGGGFLMFLADDRRALRRAMAELGYPEVRFRFDWQGTHVMVQS